MNEIQERKNECVAKEVVDRLDATSMLCDICEYDSSSGTMVYFSDYIDTGHGIYNR